MTDEIEVGAGAGTSTEDNSSQDVTPEEGTGNANESQDQSGGVQKRINELTRKRREAEREAAYWRGKAEATVSVTQETTPEPESGQELDPNDFDTDADYLKAVAKATRDEIKADLEAIQRNKERGNLQSIVEKQYNDARVKHADFDDVALNPSVPITQEMFDASIGDNLGDVLYFLGSNPDEAARISTLSPIQQAKEIGKIESKLSLPTGTAGTKAGKPPATVGGGRGSLPPKDETKMNRSELRAKWEAERRAEAGL